MNVSIRFCASADGTKIAYSVHGSGPVLIRIGTWPSDLNFDMVSSVTRSLIGELARSNTLVRFDLRGTGQSQREVGDLSFERLVEDLAAVVDSLGLTNFFLMAHSQGVAIAVAYVASHPNKCSRLLLMGGYVRGRIGRAADTGETRQEDLFVSIIGAGWSTPSSAFRRLFSTLFFPSASEPDWAAWDEVQKRAVLPATAAQLADTFGCIDVSEKMNRVHVPTLVLHCDGDQRVPVEEGRRLAAAIDSARFVVLPCNNHFCLPSDAAWPKFIEAVRAFLEQGDATRAVPAMVPATVRDLPNPLTAREQEVLELIAGGFDNREISQRLEISPNTVRNHIARVFAKLEVRGRAQAIVKAREAGFGMGRN